MSNVFGSTGAGIVIILLVLLVVILLVVTVNLNLRMTRLQRRYNLFMKGTDGVSVEKAMAERLREIGKIRSGQKVTSRGLDQLQSQYDRMLCKYGIVKYDAFEDVGGKMSFALAMLDQTNTGFVLNAIHSRDNCFLYLKDIVKGTSYIMLSDEEVEALQRAARSGEDAVLAEKPAKKKPAKQAASKQTESKPAEGKKAPAKTARKADPKRQKELWEDLEANLMESTDPEAAPRRTNKGIPEDILRSAQPSAARRTARRIEQDSVPETAPEAAAETVPAAAAEAVREEAVPDTQQ